MKAALQAWGADSNLFHQGVAEESDDASVVAATMAKPGVILRRPVGSNGPFSEHAELPKHLSGCRLRSPKARTKPKTEVGRLKDDRAARKAELAFETRQRQRERERQKEEAASAKEDERRQRATTKARAAIEKAERDHDRRAAEIETERAALEKRSRAEDGRWEKQRRTLERALRRRGG
jgi:colicin import membrane protein